MVTTGLLWRQQQTEIMDLKEELMSDTIDDVIGEADEDEERLVLECLNNLGIIFFIGYLYVSEIINLL